MSVKMVRVQLEPLSAVIDVPRGASLIAELPALGVEFPCGGTGLCGGCGIRIVAGTLPITEQDREIFSAADLASGWRLACQARVDSPLVIECEQWQMEILGDDAGGTTTARTGLGIAIDLGTTTIAAQMLNLATGSVIAVESLLNPQASFGSDVMSRVRASMDGDDLRTGLLVALRETILRLAQGREAEIVEVVLVGNTVMHHLFCGLDVEPLSRTPFHSPHLAEQCFEPRALGWPLPDACRVRFLHCLGGFVGSDILAGIVAVGMAESEKLIALVDLGTNGEIAIGSRKRIVCASTAAGPAFEAGAIHMGMRAATGAISRVRIDGDGLHATVIGGGEARGICGSGLVDAVAAGLSNGAISVSGHIADGTKIFLVQPPVLLTQADVRELQLAKGAIASGFRLLLKHLGAEASDLRAIYLAGAFGNYVQVESAIKIGLIEAPKEQIHAAGNTALRGAKMLLQSEREQSLPEITHVSLAADPSFQDEYVSCMGFPTFPRELTRI